MRPEEAPGKKDERKGLGLAGERMAEKFLRKQGYHILARNYRTPYGEIDLIARDVHETVFVEVRTRRGERFGSPVESLTRQKIQHWERAASFYLQQESDFEQPFRFDFVGVDLSGNIPRLSLVKNVI